MTDMPKDDLMERLEEMAEDAEKQRGAYSDARWLREAARALRASAGREMVEAAVAQIKRHLVEGFPHASVDWGTGGTDLVEFFDRTIAPAIRAALSTPEGWQSMETAEPDHIEIDDGTLTFCSGSLSVTVHAETAIVYDAAKDIPARRVPLGDSFWTEARDFLAPTQGGGE